MITIQRDNKTVMLTDYGKSMYGGWYCNYAEETENTVKHNGYHANTLRDLCKQAGVSMTELKRDVTRFDN